jgi:hypothetical protein
MLMLQGDDKGAAEARAPWRGERTERAGGENNKEVRRGREERREPAFSSPISCGEAASGGLASGAAHGGGWKSPTAGGRQPPPARRRRGGRLGICASRRNDGDGGLGLLGLRAQPAVTHAKLNQSKCHHRERPCELKAAPPPA